MKINPDMQHKSYFLSCQQIELQWEHNVALIIKKLKSGITFFQLQRAGKKKCS